MSKQTELEILQRLLPELEADGYEVFLEPNRTLLPKFFMQYMPDAIALRKDGNIAIEVVSKSQSAEDKLECVSKIFENRHDWKIQVISATPSSSKSDLTVQQLDVLIERLTTVKSLIKQMHFEPAYLLSWAVFEGIGRVLMPINFKRPQTPGRLIEKLAGDGYLTPTEADKLRELSNKRNRLIHGEFDIDLQAHHIKSLIDILIELIKQIKA